MKIYYINLFIFFLLWTNILVAQDIQFSQFYQNPLYLSSAFTGVTNQQRVTFNYRNQWPSLGQAFVTYSASYDVWIDELKSGLGILFTTDRVGSVGWQRTTAGLSYSYKIKLTDNWVLSPGLYFGYGINGLDPTKIRLGDGITYGGTSLDPTFQSLGERQYFDFNAGLLAHSSKIWVGISFDHINTPNISVLNTSSSLPMKINFHGGMRIPIPGSFFRNARLSYLTPSIAFRWQEPLTQLDIGVNYHVDPISVGIAYRGKPYEINESDGTINQDAIVFLLGIYLKNFTLGYSYDFSLSSLSSTSGGAHEVSVVYEFAAGKYLRKDRNERKLIPCPSFNRGGFWDK